MTNLTAREVEVVELVSYGYSNAEVGERLSLSPNTVKQHIFRICAKVPEINRGSRVSLVAWALRNGVIE